MTAEVQPEEEIVNHISVPKDTEIKIQVKFLTTAATLAEAIDAELS